MKYSNIQVPEVITLECIRNGPPLTTPHCRSVEARIWGGQTANSKGHVHHDTAGLQGSYFRQPRPFCESCDRD